MSNFDLLTIEQQKKSLIGRLNQSLAAAAVDYDLVLVSEIFVFFDSANIYQFAQEIQVLTSGILNNYKELLKTKNIDLEALNNLGSKSPLLSSVTPNLILDGDKLIEDGTLGNCIELRKEVLSIIKDLFTTSAELAIFTQPLYTSPDGEKISMLDALAVPNIAERMLIIKEIIASGVYGHPVKHVTNFLSALELLLSVIRNSSTVYADDLYNNIFTNFITVFKECLTNEVFKLVVQNEVVYLSGQEKADLLCKKIIGLLDIIKQNTNYPLVESALEKFGKETVVAFAHQLNVHGETLLNKYGYRLTEGLQYVHIQTMELLINQENFLTSNTPALSVLESGIYNPEETAMQDGSISMSLNNSIHYLMRRNADYIKYTVPTISYRGQQISFVQALEIPNYIEREQVLLKAFTDNGYNTEELIEAMLIIHKTVKNITYCFAKDLYHNTTVNYISTLQALEFATATVA